MGNGVLQGGQTPAVSVRVTDTQILREAVLSWWKPSLLINGSTITTATTMNSNNNNNSYNNYVLGFGLPGFHFSPTV